MNSSDYLVKGFLCIWLTGITFPYVGSTLLAQTDQLASHPRELTFPTLEFSVPNVASHRHVLSNGVVVFVVEDHTLPLVDISVIVRTGTYLDPVDKIGLGRLTGGQMRAGGTIGKTATEFDEQVAFLALQVGSSISQTRGSVSLNCLTKDLEDALDLFFEMLRYPGFDQARLDLAKNRMKQDMERRNDRTASVERREWGRLIRGDSHFTTTPRTDESIDAIKREDLLAFHKRFYHPDGFVFAVSGDVITREILNKLESYLVGWESNLEAVPPVPVPKHVVQPGLYLVDKPDVNQGRISLGHIGTTRDNPDRYALQVMNDLLGGGGFTARLMKRVRSDEGLAYSIWSSFGLGTYYDGVFRTRFESKSETVGRATAIVLEEIQRIRTERVLEEELGTSIASFVETFSRRFSSAASTASLFADNEYTGRNPSYIETYRDRISAVTSNDVLRVAQEYLFPDRLVFLAVGNIGDILKGDPDNPGYSLAEVVPFEVTYIPLPDPMTMKYPRTTKVGSSDF